MKRPTIVSIVFWVAFLASFGLYKYFPVIDTVWVIALRLIPIVVAILALITTFRYHKSFGELSSQGYPKWLLRFLVDEDEPRKVDQQRKVHE